MSQKETVLLTLWISLVGMVFVERWYGRTWLHQDGTIGVWAEYKSTHLNKYMFDPYSFSHSEHGMLFYMLCYWISTKFGDRSFHVWIAFRNAVWMEMLWEILENSPFMISRYRHTTAAAEYDGDSIFNSICDLLCCATGFYIAHKYRTRVPCNVENDSLSMWRCDLYTLVLVIECVMLACVGDNLICSAMSALFQ